MVWTVFDLCINAFEAYLLANFAHECFSNHQKKRWPFWVCWFFCTVFFSLFLFIRMPPIDPLVFLFPLLYSLTTSRNYLSILYWHLIVSVVFSLVAGLANQIYALLLDMPFIPYITNDITHAGFTVAANAVFYLAIRLLIRIKNAESKPSFSSYLTFFLMILSIFTTEESLYYCFRGHSTKQAPLLLIAYLSLTAILFLSVSLYHIVSESTKRESKYEAELSLYAQAKQHYDELSSTYSELSSFRHDIRHHLQALEHLATQSQNTEALKYLSQIHAHIPEKRFLTGCITLDAMLSAKYAAMKSQQISFQLTTCPLHELPIDNVDFCTIVGNLLDNAIEGIQRIPHSARTSASEIHFSFQRIGDMLYINCENPCDPVSLLPKDGLYLSSKKTTPSSLRGLGLHSIERIANKSEGRCQFICKNRVFYSQVVLPYLSIPHESYT